MLDSNYWGEGVKKTNKKIIKKPSEWALLLQCSGNKSD